MPNYDLSMSVDDTVEIDTIIKESSIASDIIDVNKPTDFSEGKEFNLKGFQTHTGVFDPVVSGDYELNINGQVLSIKVTKPGISGLVHRIKFDEGTGTVATDSAGNKDVTLPNDNWTSNSNFESNTAPLFSGSYANWKPRNKTPISIVCRVRVDSGGPISNFYNTVWSYNLEPRVYYSNSEGLWGFQTSNGNRATVSESLSGGEIRILSARLDSTSCILDVFEKDINNKVGSDSNSNIGTSFGGSTNYICDDARGSNPFGDVIDNILVFNEKLSDSRMNEIVSNQY